METVPLKEARKSLGQYHTRVATGGRHIRITRNDRDAAVLIPEADYEEYRKLKQAEIQATVAEEMRRTLPILQRGELPEGYVRYTREQVENGDWLA